MSYRAQICFWTISVLTASMLIGCGGGKDRTPINDRGRGGNGDGSGSSLGKLKLSKCGDSEKEILDLNSLKAEMKKLKVDPAVLYFRTMNSYDSSSARIPEPLGVANEDPQFGRHFFAQNRIGVIPEAVTELINTTSLLSFTASESTCSKVSITFQPEFFSFDSAIARIEEGDDLPDGAKKLEFDVDLARSGRDQVALKGPDNVYVVYRIDRGNSELSMLFIAHAQETLCPDEDPAPHVIEVEQIFYWGDKELFRLEKPYYASLKTHLKQADGLENAEEGKTFMEFATRTATIIQNKNDDQINKLACTEEGEAGGVTTPDPATTPAAEDSNAQPAPAPDTPDASGASDSEPPDNRGQVPEPDITET